MINPTTLVNMTKTIQRTALSIPRDFASRATQISNAIFRPKMAMGIKIKEPHRRIARLPRRRPVLSAPTQSGLMVLGLPASETTFAIDASSVLSLFFTIAPVCPAVAQCVYTHFFVA